MRQILLTMGALLLLLGAAEGGTGHHARAEALLRAAGVDAYLEGFAEQIGGGDNSLARSFGDMSAAWVQAADEHFAPEPMFHEMVTVFGEGLSPTDMAALEAFFASDLGRTVTEMENAAQAPGREIAMKTEGSRILGDLIASDDPRLGQLTQLIDGRAAVDTGRAMAVSLNRAVLTGMVASGQLHYSMSDDQIDALVEGQRGMMRGAIQEQLFVSLAYTYRDLPDGDLDRYIAFLTSDPGRQFYARILAATETIIGARAHDFGHRLMELQSAQSL